VSAGELEAIKQLLARYLWAFDAKRWDDLRPLLADDVRFETIEVGGTVEGADAWVDRVSAGSSHVSCVHHVHVPELELTGPTTARGVWSMNTYVVDGPRGGWRNYGHYDLDLRKESDGWRIASSRASRLRRDVVAPADARNAPAQAAPPAGDAWLGPSRPLADDDLVELEAIKQLKARQLRLLDTKQWESLRGLYADDCRFEGTAVRYDGPAQMTATLRESLDDATTVHHGHVPELRLEDARARARWPFHAYVELADGTGSRVYGLYEEEYTKREGRWLLSLFRPVILRADPLARRSPTADSPPSPASAGWLADGALAAADRLADLEEIHRLKARSFRLQDENDTGELASLFAGDALPAPPAEGTVSVRHAHMPEIRFLDDSTALGVWAFFEYLERPDGTVRQGYGHQRDEYRRIDGRWRISSVDEARLRDDERAGTLI
jgi:hypothetical protein